MLCAVQCETIERRVCCEVQSEALERRVCCVLCGLGL